MQQDEVIWQIINHSFCSFRVPTESETFCKNEFSVSNLCRKGILYLYMKVIERAHLPKKMWEKIRLSRNYARALSQIDEHMEYWPKMLKHKCKQRMTKLTQMLHRMRKLRMKARPTLTRIHKKSERRERVREEKAERAAKIDKNIERELLSRLDRGVYGNLYQFDEQEEEEMEREREREREMEFDFDDGEGEGVGSVEYVEDLPDDEYGIDSDEEEEEEIGDLEDIVGSSSRGGKKRGRDESRGARSARGKGKDKRKKRGVEVEWEKEYEETPLEAERVSQ